MNARPGCLALAFFAVVVLLPFFMANVVLTALARLGLSPELSLVAALGIFLGSTVNIPVRRIPREEVFEAPAIAMFGFGRLWPPLVRRRTHTAIAVNVGGCLVPALLAGYQLWRLGSEGGEVLALTFLAVAVNTGVCWKVARPIPEVGIAMPALVPPLIAASCALLFLPDLAPQVAFVAGVLGPLIGADLLHLDEVKEIATGTASIGGAGTFDGIVLSGLVATLLA